MKNHNEAVKDKQKRQLTAKGYKFLNRLNHIVAESKGLSIYHKEIRETKIKIRSIIEHLLIDKEMTIAQVTELIKNSKDINKLIS